MGQVNDPLDIIEARLQQLGKKVRRRGGKIDAQCPAHDDGQPSFGAWPGDTRDVVMRCLAGCNNDDIMAALGLQWTDFGDGTSHPRRDTAVAEYVYTDTKNRPVYKVVRKAGKKFHQEHVDGTGAWVSGLAGVTLLPYHLDELIIAAQYDRPIWIAEGEKDVDRLRNEGVAATCNSGGASNWKDHLDEWFNNLSNVTVIADKDDQGTKWAEDVKRRLEARGCKVRIVRALTGKDAFDHLEAGHTLDQFVVDGEQPTWPEPTPLITQSTPAKFPDHVLPTWMRAHINATAEKIQAPNDLTGILAIGAISVATVGQLKVHYEPDDWTQPCNLYTVCAVAPSVGKSPAKAAMFAPLETYEQQRMDDARKARRAHQDKIDVVTSKIAAHKKTMIKDDTFTARGLLDDYNTDLYELEQQMPPNGRIMADDATIEALGMVLADCGGNIGVVSAEGGLFDRLAGLYNENGINLDLYLEGWSGGRYVVDRVKRENINIPVANVAVVTTVQPHTIDEIGAKKVFAARGLVARFLMSMPDCNVGYRDRRRRAVSDQTATARYNAELTSIAHYYAETPAVLNLTDEATDVFSEWDQANEDRLRPDADLAHLDTWAGKLRANVLRLSALLHVAHGRSGDIDAQSVREAIELGDYFTQHMLMISERWGSDATVAEAQHIIKWLTRKALEEFSIRDLYTNNRRLFTTPEATIEALKLLTESGHIRPQFNGPIVIGKGGKASPLFAVNPAVCSVRAVCTGGGEMGSASSDAKRGFNTTYPSIYDTSSSPYPDHTVRTEHTGLSDPQPDSQTSPPLTVVNATIDDIDVGW